MNSSMHIDNSSDECFTEYNPAYRKNYSSRLANSSMNKYQCYSHIPLCQKYTSSQRKQYSHTVNQHHKYFQQHSNPNTTTTRLYGKASSTAYYDSIRARVHLTTSLHAQPKLSKRSTLPDYESKLIPNYTIRKYYEDPPLDYPDYTIDSLIERLIPSDTYIPKETFLYAMLMCSRLHIRPSLLLNKIAYLTITSLKNLTYDRSVRILQNFLDILLKWTETFAYDFRNEEMMSQLKELERKISVYEPTFLSITNRIDKQLRLKLGRLDDYEEYIRQLNTRSSKLLTLTALTTDIIDECSTSILFAQQVTHIELDRLKLIGPEELIQYFIMKSASEEARVHPNRTIDSKTTTSRESKSLHHIHDIKLTYTFETYIQWFNRLTFFVATEIVKLTQKRLRIQLINYFIDAAYYCLQICNFNSMFAILGGLNMQPVKRLRKTWEKVPLEKFNQLEQFKNISKNFAHYRNALKIAMAEARNHRWQVDQMVIPFTSLVSQDLYFIKTRSKDYTAKGGINLHKYYALTKCVFRDFIACQRSNCSFQRNDKIINYIITSPTFNEDSLMLASFECEPATTPHETNLLAKLQQEHENRAR